MFGCAFPTLIAIISMFFVGAGGILGGNIASTLILTSVILLGILMTLLVTRVLSATVLKGVPSSFTLEMPPYRVPQIGKVIVRAVFDRTIFVLGRAAAVAAPAGILIWLMANITANDISLLNLCADFLDPFAKFIGMDGVILMAFILGFPANEIVVPIMLMAYTSGGTLIDIGSTMVIKDILLSNGWSATTALCVIVFSLFHWPCSTTMLTIKKETGSIWWTALSAIIPTLCGIVICAAINLISKLV